MRRRDFVRGIIGSAAAWPPATRAEQSTLPVIGFVNSASPGGYPPVSAFLKGLDEVGLVDGRDVAIEYHWAEGHYEKLPAIIAELIQHKVNVIAATSTPAAAAAKAANSTIPVVFTTSGDPIQLGLVVQPEGAGRQFHWNHMALFCLWAARGMIWAMVDQGAITSSPGARNVRQFKSTSSPRQCCRKTATLTSH